MRIILADDHALYRDALGCYIGYAEPDAQMIVTGDFNGVMDILSWDDRVDLLMMDVEMPGMNGLAGLHQLRASYPTIPVALLSEEADRHNTEEALRLGVSGIFPKTLSGKTMLQAIYRMMQGEVFLSAAGPVTLSQNGHDASDAGQGDGTNPPRPQIIRLTPREKQVL